MLGAEVRGYVLMGLEEGGDYTVTLNAVNSAGQGPPASTRVMTLIAGIYLYITHTYTGHIYVADIIHHLG